MVDADGARNGAGPELILRPAAWLNPPKRPVSGQFLAKMTTLPALLKADMHGRGGQMAPIGWLVGANGRGKSERFQLESTDHQGAVGALRGLASISPAQAMAESMLTWLALPVLAMSKAGP